MTSIALSLSLLLAGQGVSVQDSRLAGSARREQAGWIVVEAGGGSRQIGYQVGHHLAKEIETAHAAVRQTLRLDTGENWEFYRSAARRLFAEGLDSEIRAELEGQVEGLASRGVKLDFDDVLAFNAHIELSGYYLPWRKAQGGGTLVGTTKEACSAIVATGGVTADGGIVMAHNFWWDFTVGQHFRVVLDVRPEKGHAFVMDAMPGFVHSGSDFGWNAKGVMMCETTIGGFAGFDPKGIPEFVRARRALQFADDLDGFVRIMKEGNNGGYANTWLLGDTKTGEIGKLELGLKNVAFSRTKDGAFYGANFPENSKLIAEEVPGGYNADPARNGSEKRRLRWRQLLDQHRGKIDAELGKSFVADTVDALTGRTGASGGTLCGSGVREGWPGGALQAKVVTTAMVNDGTFWARFGIPNGDAFEADAFLLANPSAAGLRGYLRDIRPEPWTLIRARR